MEETGYADLLKFGKTQKLLFVLCGGGWAIAMGVVASIAILINELHDEWGLSYSILSLLPTANMTGIFIGSFVWGTLTDKHGRMVAFKWALSICTVALVVSCFAVNIYMLAFTFVFVGFGLAGSLTTDGAVFLEYTPPSKAYLLTGMSVVCAFGGMYATGFSWLFTSLNVPMMWRYLLAVNALLNLFIVVPRFWIRETPMFLLSKGKIAEAEELIKSMHEVDEEMLRRSIVNQGSEIFNLSIKEQVKSLFRQPLKKLMILYLLVFFKQIWFFTAFTFSGIGNFLPEILKRAGEGSSSNEDIYKSMFIQNLSGIPAVLLATYLVKGFLGRKWTQVLALFMASILLFGFLIPNYPGVIFYIALSLFHSVLFLYKRPLPSAIRYNSRNFSNPSQKYSCWPLQQHQ